MYRACVRAAVLLAASALSFVPARLAAQQNFDTVTVRATKVSGSVWMITGAGGNLGLLAGEDGAVLVDDQFAPLTPKILGAVKSVTPASVKFLLNTHWHGDHTGGNDNFGRAGVIIVAHDNVRERMSKDQFMARFNQKVPAAPKAALPVVTFPDAMQFHLNGETMQATHIRSAHTDGDVVVKFVKANVLHAGDVYVRYGFPFIDEGSGGSLLGMVAGIEKVLTLLDAGTKIIPGHGALATRADVEEYLTMLKAIRDRTQSAVRKGLTFEDFTAGKPLADYESKFGAGGFVKADDILRLAYDEMKAPIKK